MRDFSLTWQPCSRDDSMLRDDSMQLASVVLSLLPSRFPVISRLSHDLSIVTSCLLSEFQHPICTCESRLNLLPLHLVSGFHVFPSFHGGTNSLSALPICVGPAGGTPPFPEPGPAPHNAAERAAGLRPGGSNRPGAQPITKSTIPVHRNNRLDSGCCVSGNRAGLRVHRGLGSLCHCAMSSRRGCEAVCELNQTRRIAGRCAGAHLLVQGEDHVRPEHRGAPEAGHPDRRRLAFGLLGAGLEAAQHRPLHQHGYHRQVSRICIKVALRHQEPQDPVALLPHTRVI